MPIHWRFGFGPQAIIDLQRLSLRWLDYWLKGVENGISKKPLAKILVMNSDEWLNDDVFPLSFTQFQK